MDESDGVLGQPLSFSGEASPENVRVPRVTGETGTFPAAVLWDMDGTLVDTEPYWIAAEYALIEEHGGTWSDEHAMNLVGSDLIDSGRYLREHSGIDLEPAACSDPECDADHGYTGVLASDDFSLRLSSAADGQDAVDALLDFAESLSSRTQG